MYISKLIELPDGAVEFKGEFSKEEISFLIEYALQSLVMRGAIPLKVINSENMASVSPNGGSAH